MRYLSVALVLWLSGCVSDDSNGSAETSASTSVQATPTTSSQAETSQEKPSSTQPSTSESTATNVEPVDSSVSESNNSSTSNERTQGKPITVTTIGAEVLGKTAIQSNVRVVDSWCEVSEGGALLALAEIANTGGLEGDFIIEFEVLNALGVRVGEGLDVVHDVKPGQSFVARETIPDVVGWEGDARSWTCQILRLSTPDATLEN